MNNKSSIDNSSPLSYPSSAPDLSQKTKKNPKIQSASEGCLPNLTSLINHTVRSVKQNISELNQKMKSTLKKIIIVFNIIIFDKKITPYNLFKKSSVPSKQEEVFKRSVNIFNTVHEKENLSLQKAPVPNLIDPTPKCIDTIASVIKSPRKSSSEKEKFRKHVNEKLSPHVKQMNKSLAKSSKNLRLLAEEPAAKGESVCCKDAFEHLTKINAELRNMQKSTKKVHKDLDVLTLLLKECPKKFGYQALNNEEKRVFVDARTSSQDLAKAIGPVKDAFATNIYTVFGTSNDRTSKNPNNDRTLIYKEGMIVEMTNPLLKCKIMVNSNDELNRLQEQCKECNKLLSSFRNDLPYIIRFAAEDSFRKVDKRVKYS